MGVEGDEGFFFGKGESVLFFDVDSTFNKSIEVGKNFSYVSVEFGDNSYL